MSAPSYRDIERFLRVDGWQSDRTSGSRRQRHIRYEKSLPDGGSLRTQISHDRSAVPSAGRWKAILRNQLRVTEAQFFEALRTGDPVDRSPPPEKPAPIPVADWVREGLRRQGLTEAQIDVLGPEEAQQVLHEHWSGGGGKSPEDR